MTRRDFGERLKAIFLCLFFTAPTGPPLNVAANPHSTTSINVTWHEVDECHRNGKITGYEVEVYNSSDHKIHSFNFNGSTYSEIVPNLVFANYSARVRALVSGKGGPFSQLQNTTPHQPGTNKETVTVLSIALEFVKDKVEPRKSISPNRITY